MKWTECKVDTYTDRKAILFDLLSVFKKLYLRNIICSCSKHCIQ